MASGYDSQDFPDIAEVYERFAALTALSPELGARSCSTPNSIAAESRWPWRRTWQARHRWVSSRTWRGL